MSDPATANNSSTTEVDSGQTGEGSFALPTDAIDSSPQCEPIANMNNAETKPKPRGVKRVVDTAEDLSDQFNQKKKIVQVSEDEVAKDKVCLSSCL